MVFLLLCPISRLDVVLIYFKFHLTHYQSNSQPVPVIPGCSCCWTPLVLSKVASARESDPVPAVRFNIEWGG